MKKLKKFPLIIAIVLIYLLQFPFAIARSMATTKRPYGPFSGKSPKAHVGAPATKVNRKSVYDSLHLELAGLNRKAFELAKKGMLKLKEQGKLVNDSILSIIDFSQPSSNKRLYILDLKNYKVLFNTLVAHGRNSGKEWARYFSNRPHSYKSSIGFYITQDSYNGENGYSLKLQGIESGINSNAYERAIVIHGANYVSQNFIDQQGYIGRSRGCPAVPVDDAEPVIDLIKDGSCLFVYSPDPTYSHRSRILN